MIRVKVPATSANVGPGFDSLGIALDLYNFVEMQECERIVVESDAAVPTDENNLIVKTAQKLYERVGFQYRGTLQLYYEDTGLTDFRLYEYIL